MTLEALRRMDLIRLLTRIGTLALAVMLCWSIADVTMRIAFNRPLHGTIDLCEATLALVAFLALPESFRRDEQIKVDVFDSAAGPRGVAVLRALGEVATLGFLILLAIALMAPTYDAYRFGDRKADMAIPIFALLAAIEVALLVSVVVVAGRAFAQVRAITAGDPQAVVASNASATKDGTS